MVSQKISYGRKNMAATWIGTEKGKEKTICQDKGPDLLFVGAMTTLPSNKQSCSDTKLSSIRSFPLNGLAVCNLFYTSKGFRH